MEMLWLVFFRSTGSAPFEGWASFFMACWVEVVFGYFYWGHPPTISETVITRESRGIYIFLPYFVSRFKMWHSGSLTFGIRGLSLQSHNVTAENFAVDSVLIWTHLTHYKHTT
jgi:hypothetical protein